MKRNLNNILYCFGILFLGQIFFAPVFALPQQKSKINNLAHFGSNTASCVEIENHSKIDNICTYIGDASFDQGGSYLQAAKIVVYKDAPTGIIYQIIATGDSQKKAFYSTFVALENQSAANSDNKQQKISGFADTIKIFPVKNLVILLGNAEIDRGQDKFMGEYFEYDTQKETIFAKPANLGQTKMVIYPQNNN